MPRIFNFTHPRCFRFSSGAILYLNHHYLVIRCVFRFHMIAINFHVVENLASKVTIILCILSFFFFKVPNFCIPKIVVTQEFDESYGNELLNMSLPPCVETFLNSIFKNCFKNILWSLSFHNIKPKIITHAMI